jgi:hypothetical protein
VPVLRQPFEAEDELPFWCRRMRLGEHHLYDLGNDPEERDNRVGTAAEAHLQAVLVEALRSVDAPPEQLQRLGLA